MEHFVTNIKTIRELEIMQVEVNYQKLLLIYTDEGIYAIDDTCPHKGISLSTGKIEGNTIKCKEHGLPVSFKTGEVVSTRQADFLRLDKNNRSVSTYQVILKNDKVYINL